MTSQSGFPVFDAAATAALLGYDALVGALRETVVEYGRGVVTSPERLVTPLAGDGLMLSMPAVAADLAIHKLVNVCRSNAARGIPTIHGQVLACDSVTGVPLFVLDGPTVTGRRTAAVTMLGIDLLHGAPREVLIVGTGTQAANHAQALAQLHPGVRVLIQGRSAQRAADFCARYASIAPTATPLEGDVVPETVDVVITATMSKTPVYTGAARAGRLVVGVGAFTPDAAEVAAATVRGSYAVVDDPLGAKHEAGDLILAQTDWRDVASLADVILGKAQPAGPVFFKSVGCAAWDLAACRVARPAAVRQAAAG
ncbi:ornithine cyclodeaminase [Burkholderia sp. WAC0059]|uniref:bifunctional Delta(1)-pyrroline-2-carboxylate/Delta(1)-piperideine-2- carboxylate reductase n=1 Tax=Burkholderia sp. WAC0059 TaxID=2066022 RepID=UPI000C7F2F72|nr:bifunctional Delta(1)-pyrroline-2-carboxylate/Delta(1)-piperideine-2-carboxylate reductase [Burkholderia sp. WAC0059]PLZ01267.1 ornithine cyclodeaminase [Burkholderia sp. WAC0059]